MSGPPAPSGVPGAFPARVIDLGACAYDETLQLQRDLLLARQKDEIPDTLVLVEHHEVITMGRGTHRENLLTPQDVPVFEIERGGDVTYHGPGQLVGYPIFLLRDAERDLHLYLRNLEEAIMRTCRTLGIATERNPGLTGVWTQTAPSQKLASIGVACKRWVTMHGFALNVSTDLSRFAMINPCGMHATVMTSMSAQLGRPVTLDEVKPLVVDNLAGVLSRDITAGS